MSTTSPRPASSRTNSDNSIPPDFDPTEHPILSRHWFGIDLCDVRQVFWNQARLGHRLPAESDVIVIAGGLS